MVDSLVLARKHSWCITHVRWPKRWGDIETARVERLSWPRNHWCAKHEALLRALWQGATVVLGILQINRTSYRSTTNCSYHRFGSYLSHLITIGIPAVFQEEELARLQYRLGMAYFFPFFQPENAKFQLVACWKCMWNILKCSWNILKCSGRW